MNIESLKDKKVIILGLGIEGMALLRFLDQAGAQIDVYDRSDISAISANTEDKEALAILENEAVGKYFGSEEFPDLNKYDIIYRSPSVYFNDPKIIEAKNSGVEVSTQIKLFMHLCPAKVIGVTGTKGKGTTASLLSKMLGSKYKVHLAGNIGYPAITLIPEIKSDDLVVLELSNFQLADIDISPKVTIVTNIDIDHLDYHKSVSEYQNAKFNILKYQNVDDLAVLNFDSGFESEKLNEIKSNKLYFSKSNHNANAIVVVNENGQYEAVLDPTNRNLLICREGETKIVGKHNFENICAAAIVADYFGIGIADISAAAREFIGLPHRLELIEVIDGVKYVNDSFATNPGPTMAAINSFREDKILILGGSYKGSEFNDLAKLISEKNVKKVVLIGDEGEKIAEALKSVGFLNYSSVFFDFEKAIVDAKNSAVSGDIILFSPACASFDMFKNYKDRGEKFKMAVSKLKDNINE